MASQPQLPHQNGLTKRAIEILRLLADGLSDREIAERLVMTRGTIKWYNRQIYRVLGVRTRTQAVVRAHELHLLCEESGIERSSQDADHHPSLSPQRLPMETTPFIGREHDLAMLHRLLDTTRLLTLVGPPGTGKTRLALQLAREVGASLHDGVYFVSLALHSDPSLAPHAILSALGVTEAPDQPVSETLRRALRDCHVLLLLDNCEHLLPTLASHVADLLAAAPQLTLLATSREPLHLYGEQQYMVSPLELPDLDDVEQLDPTALATFESIALFLQRAQEVRPDFVLTAANAADVARICVLLDGLPLAIELAAPRIKMLPPRTLLARLTLPKHQLTTLMWRAHNRSARQQTLQNTIAWSYHLLSPDEQTLFARLAIFRGGCSLDAIEGVCGHDLPTDAFELLASLVDKSLVQQQESPRGEPRFSMLETLHEYARERLAASGEASALARWHATYFVELAERAEPELLQVQQQYWFRRLEADHDNLRAALHWSLDGDTDEADEENAQHGRTALGARLAGALGHFWFACGYHAEGRAWIQQLLDRLETVRPHFHAKFLITAGLMDWMHDLDAAQRHFDHALEIARALDDTITTAWALTFKGYTMGYTPLREMDAAVAVAEEGLALFRALDYLPGIAQALNVLGILAFSRGDDARARHAYEECLMVSQATGETRRIRLMFRNLAAVARHAGEYERAWELAEQSLQIALELSNKLGVAESLSELAGVLGMTGQLEQATRLLGAWEATLERMGASPDPCETREYDQTISAIHARLDGPTFAAAWTAGRAMSLEQAVAVAKGCRNA